MRNDVHPRDSWYNRYATCYDLDQRNLTTEVETVNVEPYSATIHSR